MLFGCIWQQPAKNCALQSPITIRSTVYLLNRMAITDELLDDRVSVKQCKQAVDALHAHQSKKAAAAEASQLLGSTEQYVWLAVSVKKIPAEAKFKPVKMCCS